MATITNATKVANYFLRFRNVAFNELSDVYVPRLRHRKEKLIELIREKSAKALQSELARKMRLAKRFYTLEMSPPKVQEFKKMQEDIELVKEFIESGCYKHLTVRQAWLLFLVGTEIGLWFFLGETIGKMHIVGYKV